MPRRYLFVFLCSLFVFASLFLRPTTSETFYYVDDSATGLNNGQSSADAWTDLTLALQQIELDLSTSPTNVTVFIAPGQYSPTGSATGSVSFPSRVSFIGTGISPKYVVIDCVAPTFVVFSFGNNLPANPTTLILQNFKVTNCQGPFTVSDWSEVLLDSVVFHQNSGAPALTVTDTQRLLIQDSVFSSNFGTGNTGLFLQSSLTTPGDNTILNCEFRENTPLPGAFNSAAVFLTDDLRIINSRFINNGVFPASTEPVLLIDTPPAKSINVVIRDSIFSNNVVTNVIQAASLGQAVTVSIEGTTRIMFNQNSNAIIEVNAAVVVNTSYSASLWQNQIDGFSCIGQGKIFQGNGGSICGLSCISPIKLDRCYVCNGNTSCLGCDGIPFSPNPCPIFDSDQDGNNDTTDSVAQWTGTSPSPLLFPFKGATQYINITFGTIEERTPSGNVVQSIDLNKLPWFITVEQSTNLMTYERDYSFYSTDGSNFTIQILQTLFRKNATINSGTVTFSISDNSLKYNLVIRSWPYVSKSNSLVFTKHFEFSEAILQEGSTVITINNFTITSLNFTTANTVAKVNLQQFAVLDNVTRAITVNRIGSSTTFEFVFPPAFEYCQFDPDFGILVTSKNGEGDGDGGSDTSLIVGLTVGLVGFALLVVVGVIVVAVLLIVWKSIMIRGASEQMVNFTSHNDNEIL